ncbi:MAG: FAD:protein FMN transferase [Thermaerobacter sp.]|nr:FAD:protein FMN transferase [Thermaerobacter sp.]
MGGADVGEKNDRRKGRRRIWPQENVSGVADGAAALPREPAPAVHRAAPAITAEACVYRWTAMASPISLHMPDLGEEIGYAVARAVAEDIEASEEALSRFRQSAELVRLNACLGKWTTVSWRLYAALSASCVANRRTFGLFDPRVLQRLESYGYTGVPREAEEPREEGPWLERSPRARAVLVRAPLDLGGIGKGLSVRWAARIVRRLTRNFLLNAGGDLLACGSGPDGGGWQVGIEDPLAPESLKAALRIARHASVCTSSTSRLRWQHADGWVHHLIDPRTDSPGGAGLLAVTVIGEDPAWAEVWSKALFLHGRSGIARAAAGRAVLWVTQSGELGLTDEAETHVFWRAAP